MFEQDKKLIGSRSTFKNVSLSNMDLPHIIFLFCVCFTIVTIIFIIGVIFLESVPVFMKEGIGFIFNSTWDYGTETYGIWIFIMGTLFMTCMTIAIACPMSILTAIYLGEYAPNWFVSISRPMIELLVGIPSVVYGFFGLYVVATIFKDYINPFINSILGFVPLFKMVDESSGTGILLASSILSLMILPTITSISIEAIKSVPREYKEASISLGATRWETTQKVVLPVAASGIMVGVVLGVLRAMGETMAIVMLMGNSMHVPTSIMDSGYAMTSKIVNDIGFWIIDDMAKSALFGIAAVLILFEILAIAVARAIGGRKL